MGDRASSFLDSAQDVDPPCSELLHPKFVLVLGTSRNKWYFKTAILQKEPVCEHTSGLVSRMQWEMESGSVTVLVAPHPRASMKLEAVISDFRNALTSQ